MEPTPEEIAAQQAQTAPDAAASQASTNPSVPQAERELTYGEKAVGLTFNPSNDADVQAIKQAYASIIDNLNDAKTMTENGEQKRLYAIAITEAQSAQMWAVKAITWKY